MNGEIKKEPSLNGASWALMFWMFIAWSEGWAVATAMAQGELRAVVITTIANFTFWYITVGGRRNLLMFILR